MPCTSKPTYNYKNKFKRYKPKDEYNKWTPKQIINYNFLNLDCVIDKNKIIQLWVGYMSKQLLDNKIDTTNTLEYIEKTLIGTVKL